MRVREIDFDGLATRYDGWNIQVNTFFKESGRCFACTTFDYAKQYLATHDYLDRECNCKFSEPVDCGLDKFVQLNIAINEERKMKVKEYDFKGLQKKYAEHHMLIQLKIDNSTSGSNKEFDSFTALNNYLTSHPKWLEYSDFDCEFKHEENWNNIFRRVENIFNLTIRPCKKETSKVPYYQFCKGNICNVNGTTYAPEIKDVIFNPPATIVKWADGTKSVVKADNSEAYDPEKGLAMAIARKMYGNKYDYYNVFKKWLKKFDANAAKKALARVAKSVVNAWGTEPVSNGFRELEETDIKLQQLTGYDSKRLLDLFAEGFTLVKECNLISEENKELVNCKDCAHFAPLPSNDPWEDDGICELDGKGTYGMNTCDKAAKKDD